MGTSGVTLAQQNMPAGVQTATKVNPTEIKRELFHDFRRKNTDVIVKVYRPLLRDDKTNVPSSQIALIAFAYGAVGNGTAPRTLPELVAVYPKTAVLMQNMNLTPVQEKALGELTEASLKYGHDNSRKVIDAVHLLRNGKPAVA